MSKHNNQLTHVTQKPKPSASADQHALNPVSSKLKSVYFRFSQK